MPGQRSRVATKHAAPIRKGPKRIGKEERSQPELTHRTAIVGARLARNLIDHRRIAWDELAADLAGAESVEEAGPKAIRQKERTAKRYLASLRKEVFIGGDVPLLRLLDKDGQDIEPGPDGKIPFNRIREAELVRTRAGDDETDDDSPVADVLPQYLAFTILQLLESVLPEEEVRELWARHVGEAALGKNPRLRSFHRKFLAIPFGEKIYNRNSTDREMLDAIVDAILNERLLRIDYKKPEGLVTREIEPWSLATYKSGLYVVGRVPGEKKPRVFAIDRIEDVAPVRRDDGTPVGFSYPAEKDYDPAAKFRESFGIFREPDGKPTHIRIRIHSDQMAERIAERHFHATQRIQKQTDGTWELTMTVVGATEVEPWVLSWGRHVTILEPADLRERVEASLRDALAGYGRR